MTKSKKFNDEEIQILETNINIISASASHIKFEPKFMIRVSQVEKLVQAREVFINEGISIKLIVENRFEKMYYRWKQVYKTKGNAGFRTERHGRKFKITNNTYENLSLEEKVTLLENN